jgi:hypothetical protein
MALAEGATVVVAAKLEYLSENGVPLWYVIGTNEGHGFAKKANHDFLQASMRYFFAASCWGKRC